MNNPHPSSLRYCVAILVCGALARLAFAQATEPPSPGPAPVPERAPPPGASSDSYKLGLIFGGQLQHGGLTAGISMEALTRGIQDGLRGKQASQQDKQDANQLLTGARQSLGERNKVVARQFLAQNLTRPGVKSTASGLQYSVLKAGDSKAKPPAADSQVTVTYRGTLLDGTEFDSSFAHGKAAIFRMNSVLPGWREALSLMTPGAKWRLYLPPELGYDMRSPPNIPPGSLLTYEIDLLHVSAAGDFSPREAASGHTSTPAPKALAATTP
jgi:FKBP-type peptidyl-prolyl cis-trans isomerase FklB